MKLTVLGKYGPYPAIKGACSGYLIEEKGTKVLFDCGSGVFSRMQEYISLDCLDAVVLSHLHSDHMADLLVMRYAKNIRNTPLKVFAPNTPDLFFNLLQNEDLFEVNIVTDKSKFKIKDIEIDSRIMSHPVESYAYRIKHESGVFVYSGDTNQNDRIIPFVKDASFFLCDSAFLDAQVKKGQNVPHLTVLQAANIAKAAGVGRLALTHISPQNSELDMLNEAIEQHKDTIVVKEMETYCL